MEINFNNFLSNKEKEECSSLMNPYGEEIWEIDESINTKPDREKFRFKSFPHLKGIKMEQALPEVIEYSIFLEEKLLYKTIEYITEDGKLRKMYIEKVFARRMKKGNRNIVQKIYFLLFGSDQVKIFQENQVVTIIPPNQIISEHDPFGEEDWSIDENIDNSDVDPFQEENWIDGDERMLPRIAICLHNYDEFIEGEIYEVNGGLGDPEGAIEAGYEYMPLRFMRNIDLKINDEIVTISVVDFIQFFGEVD